MKLQYDFFYFFPKKLRIFEAKRLKLFKEFFEILEILYQSEINV